MLVKNLTLRVEEKTLSKARRIAAEHSTSVNALIRGYLDELISGETRQEAARKELATLCRKSPAKIGNKTWSRDSLYEG